MIMKQFFQAQISSCFLKPRQWSLREVRSSDVKGKNINKQVKIKITGIQILSGIS